MPVKVCGCTVCYVRGPPYVNQRLFADSDSHEAPTFSPTEEAQVTVDWFAWETQDVMKKKNESNVKAEGYFLL